MRVLVITRRLERAYHTRANTIYADASDLCVMLCAVPSLENWDARLLEDQPRITDDVKVDWGE